MRLLILTFAIAMAPLAVAAERGADARKNLAGTWKGRVDEGATGHTLVITATKITGTKDGKQDLGAGKFKLDTSTTPWHLDATRTKGSQRGQTYLGICSLEEDTLKWCVSMPGARRPTQFATRDAQFLLILKRQEDKEKDKKEKDKKEKE